MLETMIWMAVMQFLATAASSTCSLAICDGCGAGQPPTSIAMRGAARRPMTRAEFLRRSRASRSDRVVWGQVLRRPSLWTLAARLWINPTTRDARQARLHWYADRPPLIGATGTTVEWRIVGPVRYDRHDVTFDLELTNHGPRRVIAPPLRFMGVLRSIGTASPYVCEWAHYREMRQMGDGFNLVPAQVGRVLHGGTRIIAPGESVRYSAYACDLGDFPAPATFAVSIKMFGSTQELIVLPNQHIADQRIERWEDFDPAVHVLSGTFSPGGPNPPPRRPAE